MSDNPTQDSEQQAQPSPSLFHNPETGGFLKPNGEEYKFKFFPLKGEFHTAKGEVIEFRDYATRTLLDIQQRFEEKHKPSIPTQAIEIGEGEYTHEANPNDASYVEKMEAYHIKLGIFVMTLYMSFGVKLSLPKIDEMPEDFQDLISLSFDPTDPYLKHHIRRKWLERMMSSDIELDTFYRILQGKDFPTWDGLVESAKRFQGDSERVSDRATQHAEATGDNPV